MDLEVLSDLHHFVVLWLLSLSENIKHEDIFLLFFTGERLLTHLLKCFSSLLSLGDAGFRPVLLNGLK